MFTPQIQFWAMVTAAGLFALTAYLTQASRRASGVAVASALIFTGLNALWDLLAYKASWWCYPSRTGPFLPLPVYFAQDLVWGGGFGLVGWRIYQRFGVLGVVPFILLLSVLGSGRDFAYASMTKMIEFGTGVAPRLADLACWFTLLVTAQVITCSAGGPSMSDRRAAKRKNLER